MEPAFRRDAAEAHTDRYLQTPHDDESLAKKLFHIYNEGKSVVEEQGYTVVPIAIGSVKRYEADDAQTACQR